MYSLFCAVVSSDSLCILTCRFIFVNNFSKHFSTDFTVGNSKRRRRDLNPRSVLPAYSLSRGAPSASWVLLQVSFIRLQDIPASGEDGIRTHAPLRTNGFQDRLVMTTSIPLQRLNIKLFLRLINCVVVSARVILASIQKSVNNFFDFFSFFSK